MTVYGLRGGIVETWGKRAWVWEREPESKESASNAQELAVEAKNPHRPVMKI